MEYRRIRPSDTQFAMIAASRASMESPLYWLRAQWILADGIDFDRWKAMWERMVDEILLLRLKWDQEKELFTESRSIAVEVENLSADSEMDFYRMVEDRCKENYLNTAQNQASLINLSYATAFRWRERGVIVWVLGCHHSLMDGNTFANCAGLHAKLYRGMLTTSLLNGQGMIAEDRSKRHLEWHDALRSFSDKDCMLFFQNIDNAGKARGSILDLLRGTFKSPTTGQPQRLTLSIDNFDESPGARTGLPLSAWTQATVALVLRRLVGSQSIVFATTRSLRTNRALGLPEGALGLFANTLPLTIDHDDQMSVLEHVSRVREGWLSLQSVEHCPYSVALKLQSGGTKTLTVEWLVDINHYSRSDQLEEELNGICMGKPYFCQSTDFPFALSVTLKPKAEMVFISDPNSVSKEVFHEIAKLLKESFDRLISSPNALLGQVNSGINSIGESSISTPSLLQESSKAKHAFANVVDQLEGVVNASPQHIAISEPNSVWTYQQVWFASGVLAEHIRSQCSPEQYVVPIVGKRSAMTIIAVWGVLRSGKAFLILSDDGPMLQKQKIYDQLAKQFGVNVWEILVDRVQDELGLFPGAVHHEAPLKEKFANINPNSLAYVVATSGTTGVPKLVMIEHASLMYLVLGYQHTAKLTAKDTRLQAAAITSDTFVLEISLYMCHGCQLWVEPDLLQQGFEALNRRIEQVPITVIGLPSSVWKEWAIYCLKDPVAEVKRLEKLRIVVCSMERTDSDLLQRWRGNPIGQKIWLNAYGPSETACVTTILRLEPKDRTPTGNIPIGRCLPGASLEIWNEEGYRVPRGILGEIVIGGEGVGRGYFSNPEETQLRFIPRRTHEKTEEENTHCKFLYRTGDLGYIQDDGQAVFVGRLDSQIKVRGHRIELEDIEFHIRAAFSEVNDAAVVPIARGKTTELVAFYTGPGEIPVRQWISYLEQRLQAVAIPLKLHKVASIPRSQVGKVDRPKLIALHQKLMGSRTEGSILSNKEERSSFQKYIIRVLRDTLSLDLIDLTKGFIDLGGDSLSAMGVLARIERDTGVRLTPAALLMNLPLVDICKLWSETASETVHATPLTDGPGIPVYWMPDLSGDAAVIRSWIAIWHGIRPVIAIGISPRAFADEEVSIEKIGTLITDFLIASCRGQPIHILGLSFGGKVAWEVGRQLHLRSQKIGLVVIGDASARTDHKQQRLTKLVQISTHFPGWLANEWIRYRSRVSRESFVSEAYKKTQQLVGIIMASMRLTSIDAANSVGLHFDLSYRTQAQRLFMENSWKAAIAYKPSKASVTLQVLRCKIRPLFGDYSDDLGWRAVANGSVTIENLNFDHSSLFSESKAKEVSSLIENALQALEH